ncbi:methionine gamma-lyase isoform X2 [Physcomitrium patens]|nr:methionine gamma-lyase-like isoform X1 [Physcomitrium patens]|eukprot:XP_024393007.1 methionine gamma-lyase-like isoform X1 [Physcomitrella patens]
MSISNGELKHGVSCKRGLRERADTDLDMGHTGPAIKKFPDPVQTLANVHQGLGQHGGVNVAIEASSTFAIVEPQTLNKLFSGELGTDHGLYLYSRHFNPTVLSLGRKMAALEDTEAAYCTASGMSAIAAVMLQLCSSGDHIVASNRLYGGTHALLAHFLPRTCNIKTTFVDVDDLDAVHAAVQPNSKVLYFESLSNPRLYVANIPALAHLAHSRGLTAVVDNTFAPLLLSPARLGADVVVHSLSKYISGAGDIIAGAVCGPAELISAMMDLHHGALMLLGPTMDPHVAFQVGLRIPHLSIRMKEFGIRALLYAKRLKKLGLKAIYPGLQDHPHHALMTKLLNDGYGYGGMMCLDLDTKERAQDFMRYLQNVAHFGWMAVSLGYHDTLMSCSGSSTSSGLTSEEKAVSGISPGLVRMSIGFTGSTEQRWKQLLDALIALKLLFMELVFDILSCSCKPK